jgi:hypothetical protein
MKYRQRFKCWNCYLQFGYPLPRKEVASFIVECPFCHSESTVDLAEIPKSKDMLRNPDNSNNSMSGHFPGRYLWPDLIKTKPDKT